MEVDIDIELSVTYRGEGSLDKQSIVLSTHTVI